MHTMWSPNTSFATTTLSDFKCVCMCVIPIILLIPTE